jgi:hypothetical protein
MGKNTKRVKAFIEDIPDDKLTGFITSGGTIYKDDDFRLDMQGVRLLSLFTCIKPLTASLDDERQASKAQFASANQQEDDYYFAEEIGA